MRLPAYLYPFNKMPLGSGNLLNPICCTHARIFYVGVVNSKERSLSLNHRLRHIVCRVKIAEDKCEKELKTPQVK